MHEGTLYAAIFDTVRNMVTIQHQSQDITDAQSKSAMDQMPISPCITAIDVAMSKVLKECRNTICYVCVEALFSRSSMKEDCQHDTLFEMYHGSSSGTNLSTHTDLFVEGEGNYSCLFNEASSSGVGLKTIKNELTQDAGSVYFVAKNSDALHAEITKKTITSQLLQLKFPKSDKRISGATIKTNGDKVLANCKVAMSIAAEYLDRNGMLPSGCSRQDCINYVLNGMYKKLVLEGKAKQSVSSEEREKVMAEERPSSWTFPGIMAFVAFGPIATSDDHKSNMMLPGT